MTKLSDLTPEDRDKLKKEMLAEALAPTQEPLTITDIRRMSPEQIIDRKAEVDRFMAQWDGSEPEGEGVEQKTPTPLEQYKAELAALPQAERDKRANEDFASGKFEKIARGEAA